MSHRSALSHYGTEGVERFYIWKMCGMDDLNMVSGLTLSLPKAIWTVNISLDGRKTTPAGVRPEGTIKNPLRNCHSKSTFISWKVSCIFVWANTNIYIYMCVCVCIFYSCYFDIYLYKCVCVCVCICTYIVCIYIHIYTYIYIWYIYTYTYTYKCVCVCICVYIHMYVYDTL